MANTTYTSATVVNLGTRQLAYMRLCRILLHLDQLNLNLLDIVLNGDNTVSITLNNPIPAGVLAHLTGW